MNCFHFWLYTFAAGSRRALEPVERALEPAVRAMEAAERALELEGPEPAGRPRGRKKKKTAQGQ